MEFGKTYKLTVSEATMIEDSLDPLFAQKFIEVGQSLEFTINSISTTTTVYHDGKTSIESPRYGTEPSHLPYALKPTSWFGRLGMSFELHGTAEFGYWIDVWCGASGCTDNHAVVCTVQEVK